MKYILGVCLGLFLFMPNSAFAENCKTGDPFAYESPYNIESCPEDIQNWMDRANTCAYFEGEEPYDADRKAEIDGILNENQCDYIGCDARDLWGEYEGDVIYTRVISDYEVLLYGEAGAACDMEQELPPEERVGDVYLEGAQSAPVEPQNKKKTAEPKSSPDADVKGGVKGLLNSIFK